MTAKRLHRELGACPPSTAIAALQPPATHPRPDATGRLATLGIGQHSAEAV